MVYLTTCPACGVGNCEDCSQGYTRKGLIGGWHCICDHDEEVARERQEKTRKMFESD